MNRITRIILPALLALACIASTASAGWLMREVRWQNTYVGGITGTGIVVRDTAYTVLNGAAALDTTNSFTMDDADIPPRGSVSPGVTSAGTSSVSDTTVLGFLVFTADTSAVPTATLSSLTVLIDGRVGGFGPNSTVARGWVKADSALVNGAAGGTLTVGDESVAVPIRTISPYGNVRRWPQLRARTTLATGILSSCRVFVRYWKNDAANEHRP